MWLRVWLLLIAHLTANGSLIFRHMVRTSFPQISNVFISYSQTHKGYRCLYHPDGRFCISRHIIFNENRYPYSNEQSSGVVFQGEEATRVIFFVEYHDDDKTPARDADHNPTQALSKATTSPSHCIF
jgi:hypothetical protein